MLFPVQSGWWMILVYSGWHAREIHSWCPDFLALNPETIPWWFWARNRLFRMFHGNLGFISTFGIATLVTWCDWWTVELGSWSLVRWNLGLAYTSMLGIKRVSQYVMSPIPSMYGIFAYIWLIFMVNVGEICHTWILWGMSWGKHVSSRFVWLGMSIFAIWSDTILPYASKEGWTMRP